MLVLFGSLLLEKKFNSERVWICIRLFVLLHCLLPKKRLYGVVYIAHLTSDHASFSFYWKNLKEHSRSRSFASSNTENSLQARQCNQRSASNTRHSKTSAVTRSRTNNVVPDQDLLAVLWSLEFLLVCCFPYGDETRGLNCVKRSSLSEDIRGKKPTCHSSLIYTRECISRVTRENIVFRIAVTGIGQIQPIVYGSVALDQLILSGFLSIISRTIPLSLFVYFALFYIYLSIWDILAICILMYVLLRKEEIFARE